MSFCRIRRQRLIRYSVLRSYIFCREVFCPHTDCLQVCPFAVPSAHDIPDSLIQEGSPWHQTVGIIVSAVCFDNGQPASFTLGFSLPERLYLFFKPFFQGICLPLRSFLPVLCNDFPVQFVCPFHLCIDQTSVLPPELEDPVRVELWQLFRGFAYCQKPDTPGIHFVELVLFGLLITQRGTNSCRVPAGTVKDMFFAKLLFQLLAEERNRLVQDT